MKTLLKWSFLIISFSSSAIIIRHDVKEVHYKYSRSSIPAIAMFQEDGLHGTLIHPSWVVTAAHASYCLTNGSYIEINHILRRVENVYHFPESDEIGSDDIALVELTSLVTDVTPMKLNQDTNEKGQIITFAGSGGGGTGTTGPTEDDPRRGKWFRFAQNTVVVANKALLKVNFDQGEKGLQLEGIPGYGDSGGPTFATIGGEKVLFGVVSHTEGPDILIGKYGITDVSMRISFFKQWIDDVITSTPLRRAKIATLLSPINPKSAFLKICQKDAFSK